MATPLPPLNGLRAFEVSARHLFEQETIAVASPQIAERVRTSPEDLTLLHDSHDLWPQMLELALPATAPPARRNLRFNHTSLAIDAALAGQGIALCSRSFVAEDLAAGRLVQVFGTRLRTGDDFYLLHPRKPRNAAAVEAVRSWLLAEAQA